MIDQSNRVVVSHSSSGRGTPEAPSRTGKPHSGKSPSTVYVGHGKDKCKSLHLGMWVSYLDKKNPWKPLFKNSCSGTITKPPRVSYFTAAGKNARCRLRKDLEQKLTPALQQGSLTVSPPQAGTTEGQRSII